MEGRWRDGIGSGGKRGREDTSGGWRGRELSVEVKLLGLGLKIILFKVYGNYVMTRRGKKINHI